MAFVVCVTGATGFVGGHIAVELLQNAPSHWIIRAAVRCRDDDNSKLDFLRKAAASSGNDRQRLQFARFDIDDGGDDQTAAQAFRGATIVIHAAAKVAFESKDPEAEIVEPSVRGTDRVLRLLDRASTKVLVFVSSIAAVRSFDKPDSHVFTEQDWNTWSTVANGDAYGFAKTAAEKLVREFASQFDDALQVVTVNPGVCFGPPLAKAHTKASPIIVRQMLYGNSLVADQLLAVVDARDVAKFIRMVCCQRTETAASRSPRGYERFILTSDNLLLSEIGAMLSGSFTEYAPRAVFDHSVVLWLKSWFMSPFWRESFSRRCVLDGARATREIQDDQGAPFEYMDIRKSLHDTANTMVNDFDVKPRPASR